MIKKLLIALPIFLGLGNLIYGQQSCQVVIIDHANSKPVSKSTIILVKERNGKLVDFKRTNGLGKAIFLISERDSLKWTVSHSKFVSYQTKSLKCGDTVKLFPKNRVLKEVIVIGQKAVTMSGDTVSYIADSFKVPPGANVEDLLKRLPGIQVAQDGTIKAQGKKVDRVLVDGDDFFGSDAKLATRNLDASMIDKVEVIDVESKQAQLTGMADEEKTKIINLKLKDEAKKGFFGKSKQGYSNTNRYESTNMVHGFRDKLKVAAYAIADNLNSELDWQDRQDLGLDNNWSYDEELDMWIQNGGGPNNNHSGVIPQNLKIGARVSKKMEDESGSIQGKYNYQQQDFDGSTRNINTQIFDQGKRISDNTTSQIAKVYQSRMGLEIDKRIDTANKIDFEFSGAVYGDDGRYHTKNNIFQDSTLINASEAVSPYVAKNETYHFKSNIEHKFKKKGRVITGSADYKFSKMSNLSTSEMVTRTVLKTGDTVLANFDRFNSNMSNTSNIKLAVQYIEPIIKEKLNIIFDLNMLYSKDNTYQNTYDRNQVSGEFSDLVRNMSNNYNYDVVAFSQKLALNYKSKKFDFGIGSKLQETKLFQNNLDSGNADLNRNFFFVLPNASVNWKYRRNSGLNLNFNTSIKPPTLAELQPYTSNSGPLFLQIGNPNLVPTYNYRFSLRNSFWYPISQSSLWSSINFTMKENDIVQNITFKETGEQIRSYTQVNGNFDLRGNVYYSFHIKKLDLNVNPGANFSYGKSSVVNNSIVNSSYRTGLDGWLSVSKNIDSTLQSSLSYSIGWDKTDVENSLFNNNQQLNMSIGMENSLKLPWKFKWKTDLRFQYLPSTNSFNGDQSFVLFTSSLERPILKDNSLFLGLTAYDIFDQNRNITRYFFGNNISENFTQALTRYFMLTLEYKFKSNSKKKADESENL
jgi:hypothetical protein